MKKSILFVLSFFMVMASYSQITIRVGTHDAPSSWTPSTRSNFSSTSQAKNYAQEIIDVVGLKANFEVMAANVENAAAVVYGGKRYVLYNPNFINALVQKTGNKWAAISVLAHEIGHHLNGHTVTATGSQPSVELEADEFSGFVLRKMGASLADAQAAMKVLASETASRTHPAKHDRLAYIAKGWQSADDQAKGRDIAKIPDFTPQQQPQISQPRRNTGTVANRNTNSNASIIGDVRFKADPYSKYYITSQYNLVKVANNRMSVIGKVSKLNSQNYPYVIYDESNTQLLVDARGSVVTRTGKEVGIVTPRRI